MTKPNKYQAAKALADAHYAVDPGITAIFRLEGPPSLESDPREPIKLLEVNSNSAPLGIRPVFFGADSNIPFPSIVVDIAPEEYRDILAGKLPLPNGWKTSVKYPLHKRVMRFSKKRARKAHRSSGVRS